ncbi:MAG TPA: hypothetical protein VF637_17265 [Sphingomicrobium sp.]|jgi:3-hydroxy-3-methylglutaryl CoA synthase
MQQPPTQQSDIAAGAGSELRSDARQLGSSAANRLHGEVDSRKSQAADQAKSVSSAIHKAAGELDQSTPAWLTSAFRQGADQVQRFADTIEQKDSRQLRRDAQDFARNNPGTFLAACAAAGFAAARIFKAGGEQQSTRQFTGGSQEWDQSQPWGNGEQDAFGQNELSDDLLGQGQQSNQPIADDPLFRPPSAAAQPTDTRGEFA